MTVLYLEALVAIALSLPVLTAGARIVQQRTGNSGSQFRVYGSDTALWMRPGE